jgi:hypothetical protein
MTARKRTPRKTPPGTKPLPRKISPADLTARKELQERDAMLGQARADIETEIVKLAGRWEQLREMHGEKYRMSPADTIGDDGGIVRADADR